MLARGVRAVPASRCRSSRSAASSTAPRRPRPCASGSRSRPSATAGTSSPARARVAGGGDRRGADAARRGPPHPRAAAGEGGRRSLAPARRAASRRSGPADGRGESALTVFLAGAECPFACVFCDLWRSTLDGPTPRGAIPAQIQLALAGLAEPPPGAASSSTTPATSSTRARCRRRTTPRSPRSPRPSRASSSSATRGWSARAASPSPAARRHARGGDGARDGPSGALPRLNKGMTLDDFARAADPRRRRPALRAFVLVGAPFVPAAEAADWAVGRSATPSRSAPSGRRSSRCAAATARWSGCADAGELDAADARATRGRLDAALARCGGDRHGRSLGRRAARRLPGLRRGARLARLGRINRRGAPSRGSPAPRAARHERALRRRGRRLRLRRLDPGPRPRPPGPPRRAGRARPPPALRPRRVVDAARRPRARAARRAATTCRDLHALAAYGRWQRAFRTCAAA